MKIVYSEHTVFGLISALYAKVFQNYWKKLVVKYPPNKDTLQRKISRGFYEGASNGACAIFFLIFYIKAYVVGTHLICLNLLRQCN